MKIRKARGFAVKDLREATPPVPVARRERPGPHELERKLKEDVAAWLKERRGDRRVHK